jgi:hypothetical protein
MYLRYMHAGIVIGFVFSLGCGQRTVASQDAGAGDGDGGARWQEQDGFLPVDSAPLDPAACAALAGYAGGKLLTPLHARQALFSRSLDRVVIVSHEVNAPGNLYAIPLPSGQPALLETDVTSIEWLGQGPDLLAVASFLSSSHTYELKVIPTTGGPSRTLATEVCHHLASPDGARVYVVHSCKSFVGTLEMVDTKTGSKQWLADKVPTYELVVSPDSQWVGFISDLVDGPPGCQKQGHARVASAAGKTYSVRKDALRGSLQFLPAQPGTLLVGAQTACPEYFHGYQLMACAPTIGSCTALGTPHDYGYAFHLLKHRYSVSSDGKRVLGATSDPEGIKNQLYVIRTDGKGEQAIAGDLFPYMMVSAVFDAWTFTRSGQHVVYTRLASTELYPTMGLTAVSATGGTVLQISPDLSFASYRVSPTRDEVVFVEQIDTGGMRAMLASTSAGSAVELLSSKQSLRGLSFLPDGRGLLLLEQSKGGAHTRLHYTARDGASSPALLGEWDQSLMNGYEVDPSGCVVLYDTDLGESGTYLAHLPQ